MEILITILLAVLFFVAPAVIVRELAKRDKLWIFTPANTFALIVTHEDESGDGMKGSGTVVDVLHGVSGQTLVKDNDPDPMNWHFEKIGEDPRHSAFLFRTLGIQSMGNPFWKPRVNVDRHLRFAQEGQKEELRTVAKAYQTRNVFYTGDLTVKVKEADTFDLIGLNFEIDFVFARKFPVRSVLKLADASAFLTSLVENIVNNMTTSQTAEAYIGGPHAEANRKTMAERIENDVVLREVIEREIGFDIEKVSIRDVTMDPKYRALLELKVTAEKTKEAQLIDAEREKQKQILKNDADADRIARVIKPAAASPEMALVRWADAYENNKTMTTFAPGASTAIPLGK
ncbi:MAG: SPFH domain-containing protein [Patescibacteria group bacterium]